MPPSRTKRNPDSLEEPTIPAEIHEFIAVDPILPLPGGTSIPPVKNHEGGDVLSDTRLMMIEMPYRAMYFLWEHAEKVAAQNYPKYVGGPLDKAAQAALEAVHAFRSAARGEILPILSEEEVQKLRAKAAKKKTKKAEKSADEQLQLELDSDVVSCSKCGGEALKKKREGKKIWKCADCGFRWPRSVPGEAPESPSKGRTAGTKGSRGRKAEKATQRGKKKPAKNR